MKSVILILSLALLIFGGVSVADATAVDFAIGADNSIDYDSAELAIVSETYTFPGITQLNVGDSFEFDYGTIERIEVITSQDTYSITAYLSFIQPEEIVVGNPGTVTTVKVTGMCGKTSDKFWIDFEPVDVIFDTNGSFTVELSDIYAYPESISDGCGSGCYYPKADEGTITATVTLNKSPTPVPEPSTFILFGTVLLGALGVKRIKR